MRNSPLLRPTLLVCALAALIGLTCASPALAGKSSGGFKPIKSTPPPVHTTTIATVTATSITINEDKTPRTFAISQFTEVTVNGARATVADLKPGMNVSITLKDPTSLSRITAVSK